MVRRSVVGKERRRELFPFSFPFFPFPFSLLLFLIADSDFFSGGRSFETELSAADLFFFFSPSFQREAEQARGSAHRQKKILVIFFFFSLPPPPFSVRGGNPRYLEILPDHGGSLAFFFFPFFPLRKPRKPKNTEKFQGLFFFFSPFLFSLPLSFLCPPGVVRGSNE